MKNLNMISRRSFLKAALTASAVSAMALTGCGGAASSTASSAAVSSSAAASGSTAAAGETFKAVSYTHLDVYKRQATIRSRSYEKLLRQLVPGVEITARPCPLFVPLVEAGYVDHSEAGKQQITKLVIAQYLTEVREAGVDTLILGCTHYPLLKSMIGEFMGCLLYTSRCV